MQQATTRLPSDFEPVLVIGIRPSTDFDLQRQLDGGYRAYARGRRRAPHAALQSS